MTMTAHAHTHHKSVYGVTFEKVREPRVKSSALNNSTRTITKKPSVATATKCPDKRISTKPTSSAMNATKMPAISIANKKPSGNGPSMKSKWTPASHAGSLGKYSCLTASGSVRIAEIYAPSAINPICPNENTPVNPLDKFKLTVRIINNPTFTAKPCQTACPENSSSESTAAKITIATSHPMTRRKSIYASRSGLPKMPYGRNSSTRIKIINTNASR